MTNNADDRTTPSARFAIADFSQIDPVRCPCGWARRAFGNIPGAPLSLHTVDIELDAETHFHEGHTEVYYILECDSEAQMELDGRRIPITKGQSIYIPPGVRHRAIGKMRILNIVLPPFDPADEHFD
ncbi:cupin domain-containing protein [bacterium]|nr:cupin domain-containing protein [bacterium]